MTLKIVLRNLQIRPFLNFVKVVGLSLSLSCILLIALFLKNELSYDNFHERSGSIYRFTLTNPDFFSGKHFARIVNPTYVPAMADYFPEIEKYVRLVPISRGVRRYGEESFVISQAFECDSTFFEIFHAELLVGNQETVLDGPG